MQLRKLIAELLPEGNPADQRGAEGLLHSWAQPDLQPEPGMARVWRELELLTRQRLLRAVESLLRHHLGAAATRGGALWFGWPELGHEEAWRELRRAGAKALSELELPAPGESLTALVERLLRIAHRIGGDGWEERLLWLTRIGLVDRRFDPNRYAGELKDEWLRVDLAALHLDRGEVRRAQARLEQGPLESARGRQLAAWCAAALGERVDPQRLLHGGPLSLSLRALVPEDVLRRGELCAGRRPGRWPELPRQLEHRRLAGESPLYGLAEEDLRAVVRDDRAVVRSVGSTAARVSRPVHDGNGRLTGWMTCRFDHAYLPPDSVLAEWAGRAEVESLEANSEPSVGVVERPRCVEWAAAAAAGVGGELRRLYLFEEGVEQVCGGEPPEVAANASLRRRAYLSQSCLPVAHGGEGSWWVPVHFAARNLGCCEVSGLGSPPEGFGSEAAAQFAWLAFADRIAQLEGRILLTPKSEIEGLALRAVPALLEGKAVLLQGPAGSGKRTLAHWLHASLAERPKVRQVQPFEWPQLLSIARAAQGGSLLLFDIDPLGHREFAWLRRLLKSRFARGVRCLLTTTSSTVAEQLATLPCLHVERVPGLDHRAQELQLWWREAQHGTCAVPLADEVCAQLFRQLASLEWPGLVKLLAALRGSTLPTLDVLREALFAQGGAPVSRRKPVDTPRGVLQVVLEATATDKGRWNRARAARWLGWDRQTLSRRLECQKNGVASRVLASDP